MVHTGNGVGASHGSLGERRRAVWECVRIESCACRCGCHGWVVRGGRSVGLGGWVVVPAVRAVRYNLT